MLDGLQRRLFCFWDRLAPNFKAIVILVILVWFLFNLQSLIDLLNAFTDPATSESMIMLSYLVSLIVGFVAIVIYFSIWRMVFPAYWIVGKNTAHKSGRLYWWSHSPLNMALRERRKKLGVPVVEPDSQKLYIFQGRFLNIFMPKSCMTVVYLPLGAKLVRLAFRIRSWEPSTRRVVVSDDGCIEYCCLDGSVTSTATSSTDIEKRVDEGVKSLIETIQTAVQGDVAVAKEKMRHSTIWLPPDVVEEVDRLEE